MIKNNCARSSSVLKRRPRLRFRESGDKDSKLEKKSNLSLIQNKKTARFKRLLQSIRKNLRGSCPKRKKRLPAQQQLLSWLVGPNPSNCQTQPSLSSPPRPPHLIMIKVSSGTWEEITRPNLSSLSLPRSQLKKLSQELFKSQRRVPSLGRGGLRCNLR